MHLSVHMNEYCIQYDNIPHALEPCNVRYIKLVDILISYYYSLYKNYLYKKYNISLIQKYGARYN